MSMKRNHQAPGPSGANWHSDVYEDEEYSVVYPPYKSRRTVTQPDGTIATEEREHNHISKNVGPPVEEIKTGSDLNIFNFGQAVSLHKDQLPENALLYVTQLNKVEVKGEQTAVYMTSLILMQAILINAKKTVTESASEIGAKEVLRLTEEDAEFDINKDDNAEIQIIDSDFRDYSGEVVTKLIKCTAPPSVAKAL